jgi:hypothetical protein
MDNINGGGGLLYKMEIKPQNLQNEEDIYKM